MPRFFFDLREDGRFFRDEEGTLLPDLDAAECEAAKVAAEIGRDQLPANPNRVIIVEVRNEHNQRLLTVVAGLNIVRVDPSARPAIQE